MSRWKGATLILGITLMNLCGVVFAKGPSQTDRFEDAVDLKRFRKGNLEWDTQEMIASGFRALHEDHLRVLKELEELKEQIAQIKERAER